MESSNLKKNFPEMFCKEAALENFAKFKEKHLEWGPLKEISEVYKYSL